ncbi:MAG: AMP-binding protein [Sedimentisphaerales bacterium]|nr:AMP-binding protein [Sedimentisphaerales bacterium]
MSILKYPDLAFQSSEVIYKTQEDLLRRHLRHICDNSPYYRDKLKGIDIEHFTLDSLQQLPLTDKSDFSHHNDQFQAVSDRAVEDMSFSSGTTGQPTKFVYTRSDLERLAYNEAQGFRSCGFTDEDIILLTCTMDRCFIAGLAYYSGPRSLGAALIRNGNSTLASHLDIIKRISPTAMIGVPSFLLKLGKCITSEGFNLADHSIKRMVCIGEPLRDRELNFLKAGEELERIWGAKVYSTYASTETITAFCECEYQRGGHYSPDLGIVEIVDENDQNLPNGEVGEVVVTPLQMEGMPMIRYKTGDISFIIDTGCPCGRNIPRLGPILGRRNQMMKIHGTTMYPQSVQAVLDGLPQVKEYYLKVQHNESFSEHLTVYVALDGDQSQADDILQKLQARLRVKPELKIVPIEEIRKVVYRPESRKPVRFIDERK